MSARVAPNYHIALWLLALYLGTAPIYWLPGVSLEAIATAKALLASVSVLAVLMQAIVYHSRVPAGPLGPVGFLTLILLSTSGIAQAEDISRSIEFVFAIIIGVGFMWCFALLGCAGADLPKLFVRSMLIMTTAAFLTLFGEVIGQQNLRSPFEEGPLSATGFGAGRTGWSNGLSFYLPATLLLFPKSPRRRYAPAFQLLIIASIVGSQALSGGRAGLLASLFILACFMFLRSSRTAAAVSIIA